MGANATFESVKKGTGVCANQSAFGFDCDFVAEIGRHPLNFAPNFAARFGDCPARRSAADIRGGQPR
jgi:hypothetical protein